GRRSVQAAKRVAASASADLQADARVQFLKPPGVISLLPPNNSILVIQEHEGWEGVDAKLTAYRTGGGITPQQQPVVDGRALAHALDLADPFLDRSLFVSNGDDL